MPITKEDDPSSYDVGTISDNGLWKIGVNSLDNKEWFRVTAENDNNGDVTTEQLSSAIDIIDPEKRIGPVSGYLITDNPVVSPEGQTGSYFISKDQTTIDGVDVPANTVLRLNKDTLGGVAEDWDIDPIMTAMLIAHDNRRIINVSHPETFAPEPAERLLEVRVFTGALDLTTNQNSVAKTDTIPQHQRIVLSDPDEPLQRVRVFRNGYLPLLVRCRLVNDSGTNRGVMISNHQGFIDLVSNNDLEWELQSNSKYVVEGNNAKLKFNLATALNIRIDTSDDMPYRIVWPDGSENWIVSGELFNKTFASATEGFAELYLAPNSFVTRLSNLTVQWAFDLSALTNMGQMEFLATGSAPVTGDVAYLFSMDKLTYIQLGSDAVYGQVDSFSAMKLLTTLQLSNTSVGGNINKLLAIPGIERLRLGATKVMGDIAGLAGLVNLIEVHLGSTEVFGDVGSLAPLILLEKLYLLSTDVSGELSSLAINTELTDLHLQTTKVKPSDATLLNPLVNLTEFFYSAILSRAEVDTFIEQLAAGTLSDVDVNIAFTNATRSQPESDADVATFEARSNTLTTS